MALARVVSFEGVSKERMDEIRALDDPPEGLAELRGVLVREPRF